MAKNVYTMWVPSSLIITSLGQVSELGKVKRLLVGRLLVNRQLAAATEAVLPAVPALEDVVTAQAGGRPRIHGAKDFPASRCSFSTRGFFTHNGLSETQGIVEVIGGVRPHAQKA
jgi:hypothetical protein